MQEPLRPLYGTHVSNDGYWRGALPPVAEVVATLTRGESVKCFGLRRLGKSSLFAETKRQIEAAGRQAIWIDLQRLHSLPAVLQAILAGLRGKGGVVDSVLRFLRETPRLPPEIKAKAEQLVEGRIDALDPNLDRYINSLFDQVGIELGRIKRDERPILIFDELPFFCLNLLEPLEDKKREREAADMRRRLNEFLTTLRNWRGAEIGVAMAFTGSVSMLWLERKHRVSNQALNDCPEKKVRPMPRAEAEAMVRAMLAHAKPTGWERGRDADFARALVDHLPAYFPGVIQAAFQQMRDLTGVTLEKFDEIYDAHVPAALRTDFYSQFDARLKRYASAERKAAYALFDALSANKGEPLPKNKTLALCKPGKNDWIDRELVDRFEDDGFIDATGKDGVSFASGLVPAWLEA